MTNKQQIISKGTYTHSQIADFFTLKQYIFFRKNGQKCLLLKFVNETEFFINSVRFKLIQLDSEGKVICRQNLHFDGFTIGADCEYIPLSRIVVNEKCADFKVVIDYVDSGYYRYRVRGGRVLAFYNAPNNNESKSLSSKEDPVFNVTSYRAGKRRSVSFVATVVGLALTVVSVLLCLFDLIEKNRSEEAQIYENIVTVCETEEFLYEENFGVDNA